MATIEENINSLLKKYKKDVTRTWIEPKIDISADTRLKYELVGIVLGLVNEAAEVSSEIEKYTYRHKQLNIEKVKEELGDMFYYFILICEKLNISLTDLIKTNIEKRKNNDKSNYRNE